MRKLKRWLCIVHLAMLVSTTLFVLVDGGAETCPDRLLLPTNCYCQGVEGWMQVECVLSAQQDLLTVLQTIGSAFSNTTTTIHKITIKHCAKGVELLEPLPKLKIRSLQISGCGIKRVHEKAFDAMSDSLEQLSLTNNSISTLPFLKKLRKLQVINLSWNLLNDIPERSFDGLDQLRQLRLKHNRICLLLPNALNETKTSLELLDLSHNCLVTVPAQNLRNSIGLTHLDLAGNQIGDVAQMQFMNLPKLLELRLNSNRLKGIAPNGFMNVPQLKHFLARDNVLHQLDGQTLQAFKQLEVIDLSANSFARIPSFKDHSNLVQIHMDSNLIQKIDTLAFSANPKLNLISLQHNVISTISRNSFDSLAALTTLNLANNSLEFIERNMFDGVRNLKNLLIHNNHIMHINNASFTSIADLVVIDLSGNKLQKIQAGTFSKLPKLFFVDLSNNLISTFEKGAFHTRVANIFLDGNQLDCGADFGWFVTYLVDNNVRTFVPNQPEITCASPESMVNVRLKELMMTKANQTQLLLNERAQSSQPTSFLAGLIPGLVSGGAPRQPVSEVNSVEPAVPSSSVRIAGSPPQMSPDVQLQQPSAADIAQMLKNMPSMVVNIPVLVP
uniref:Uncharacterized protein n=1 Tax=Ditylenchus dipsaci TaxID=166011 RepID=A0A915CWA3_9BILA